MEKFREAKVVAFKKENSKMRDENNNVIKLNFGRGGCDSIRIHGDERPEPELIFGRGGFSNKRGGFSGKRSPRRTNNVINIRKRLLPFKKTA